MVDLEIRYLNIHIWVCETRYGWFENTIFEYLYLNFTSWYFIDHHSPELNTDQADCGNPSWLRWTNEWSIWRTPENCRRPLEIDSSATLGVLLHDHHPLLSENTWLLVYKPIFSAKTGSVGLLPKSQGHPFHLLPLFTQPMWRFSGFLQGNQSPASRVSWPQSSSCSIRMTHSSSFDVQTAAPLYSCMLNDHDRDCSSRQPNTGSCSSSLCMMLAAAAIINAPILDYAALHWNSMKNGTSRYGHNALSLVTSSHRGW